MVVLKRRVGRLKVRDFHNGGTQYQSASNCVADFLKNRFGNCSNGDKDESNFGKIDQQWRPSLDPELVVVEADGISAKYTGYHFREYEHCKLSHGRIVGQRAVTSPVSYFEVSVVVDKDTKCGIRIGMCPASGFESTDHLIGSNAFGTGEQSFVLFGGLGYSIVNGQKLDSTATSKSRPLVSGDIVGCGCIRERKKVFFTLNSEVFATFEYNFLDKGMNRALFPCVSMRHPGERVVANFGSTPFSFPIRSFMASMCKSENVTSSYLAQNEAVAALVKEYLEFHGYKRTLEHFERESGIGNSCPDMTQTDNNFRTLSCVFSDEYQELVADGPGAWRQSICPLASIKRRSALNRTIMGGEPEKVLLIIKHYFPMSIQRHIENESDAFKALKQQQFIELVRSKRTMDAVSFARTELDEETARKLIPLVAFSVPEASPYKHFFSASQRECTADIVNRAILAAVAAGKRVCYVRVCQSNKNRVDNSPLDIEVNEQEYEEDAWSCYEDDDSAELVTLKHDNHAMVDNNDDKPNNQDKKENHEELHVNGHEESQDRSNSSNDELNNCDQAENHFDNENDANIQDHENDSSIHNSEKLAKEIFLELNGSSNSGIKTPTYQFVCLETLLRHLVLTKVELNRHAG